MRQNATERTVRERRQEEQPDQTEAEGCLLRVYWMLLGNALVAFFAFGIVNGGGAIATMDLLYWLGAASLVTVRYVEVRYAGGKTVDGEPATMKHWRRYAWGVLAVSVILWAVVHSLGYLMA